MAIITSGIFSTPRGKISDSIWISPRTGKIYSPPPRHKDKRSELQLLHRRKMRVMAPVLRWFAKHVSAPIWGARIKYLTPYTFAVGLSLPLYYDWNNVQNLRVLMLYDKWWSPYYLGSLPPNTHYSFIFRPLPDSLIGRDVQMCFTAYTTVPFRTKTTGWIPYAVGPLPGFSWQWQLPVGDSATHFIAAYQEDSGLWIYVGESVNYYSTPYFL